MRYEYSSRKVVMRDDATGLAITNPRMTSTPKSDDNFTTMLRNDAPSTLRMPTSFLRRRMEYAAMLNNPIPAMTIAMPANVDDVVPNRSCSLYSASNDASTNLYLKGS